MAQTPAKTRSNRAPSKANKPRAAARSARKSADAKTAKAAPKPAAKAAKATPKARSAKAVKPAMTSVPRERESMPAPPTRPGAAAVRRASRPSEEQAPSLARYVREDHKLRESRVDEATPQPWWGSAFRSALMLASAGARMVRRYVPGLRTSDDEERDTLVPV